MEICKRRVNNYETINQNKSPFIAHVAPNTSTNLTMAFNNQLNTMHNQVWATVHKHILEATKTASPPSILLNKMIFSSLNAISIRQGCKYNIYHRMHICVQDFMEIMISHCLQNNWCKIKGEPAHCCCKGMVFFWL